MPKHLTREHSIDYAWNYNSKAQQNREIDMEMTAEDYAEFFSDIANQN